MDRSSPEDLEANLDAWRERAVHAEARCAELEARVRELEARLMRHEGPEKHPDPEHAPRIISRVGKVRLRAERAVHLLELSATSGREEGNMYEAIEGWNWAETRLAALTEAARDALAYLEADVRLGGVENRSLAEQLATKLRAALEEK
jgi:hypothetical protein